MQPHDPAFGVSCRHGHNLAIGNPSAGQDRTKLIFLRFPCPGDLVQGAIKDLLTGLVEIVADLGLARRPEIGIELENHVELGRPVTGDIVDRSEEHTSELQSLKSSSSAVFCLKKKKK